MKERKLKLSPPWSVYYEKIKALFERDNDVQILFNEREPALTLRVYGTEKAWAIERLLGKEIDFGGVTLKINVVPVEIDKNSTRDILRAAFKNNPALSRVEVIDSPIGSFTYAMFDSDPVFLQDDDISSPYGYTTKLYQDIAKDVMDIGSDVFVCSDKKTFSF